MDAFRRGMDQGFMGLSKQNMNMGMGMDDVADKIQALEDTNRVLQTELQKSEEESRQDKDTIEIQSQQLSELKERMTHDRDKYKTRIEKTSEKFKTENEKLLEENNFLKETMDAQKAMVEENQRRMAIVMEENQDLSMIKKDLIMNHMNELENLHEKIKQLNKQLESQSRMLNVSKSERESKESVYHEEIIQLKKDNGALNKDIQTQRVKMEQLEAHNKEAVSKLRELSAEKNRMQEDFDTNLAIERSSITSEKEKCTNDMQGVRDEYEKRMQEERDQYEKRMTEDRDLYERTLEQQINTLKGENTEQQRKDRELFETTLENEIGKVKKETKDEQLKDRELFETTLERELNRIKEECAAEQRQFISDFDSRETDYDSRLKSAHEQTAERSKELDDLRQALVNQEKDSSERMRHELTKRDEEIRKMNDHRVELERRLGDNDNAMKERDKEVDQMKRKVHETMRISEENCARCGTNFQQDKNRLKSIRTQTDEVQFRKPNQGPKVSRVFMARYSYNPKTSSPNEFPETELGFRAGDYILMEEQVNEDGYFRGRLLSGEEGFVPLPFVEKVAEYGPSHMQKMKS